MREPPHEGSASEKLRLDLEELLVKYNVGGRGAKPRNAACGSTVESVSCNARDSISLGDGRTKPALQERNTVSSPVPTFGAEETGSCSSSVSHRGTGPGGFCGAQARKHVDPCVIENSQEAAVEVLEDIRRKYDFNKEAYLAEPSSGRHRKKLSKAAAAVAAAAGVQVCLLGRPFKDSSPPKAAVELGISERSSPSPQPDTSRRYSEDRLQDVVTPLRFRLNDTFKTIGRQLRKRPNPEHFMRPAARPEDKSKVFSGSHVQDPKGLQERLWAVQADVDRLQQEHECLLSAKQARQFQLLSLKAGEPIHEQRLTFPPEDNAKIDLLHRRTEELLDVEDAENERKIWSLRADEDTQLKTKEVVETLEASLRKSIEEKMKTDDEASQVLSLLQQESATADRLDQEFRSVTEILARKFPDGMSSPTDSVADNATRTLAAADAHISSLRECERTAASGTARFEAQANASRRELASLRQGAIRQLPLLEHAEARLQMEEQRWEGLRPNAKELEAYSNVSVGQPFQKTDIDGKTCGAVPGQNEDPSSPDGFRITPVKFWLQHQCAVPPLEESSPASRSLPPHVSRQTTRETQLVIESQTSIELAKSIKPVKPTAVADAKAHFGRMDFSVKGGGPAAFAAPETRIEDVADASLQAQLRLLQEDRLRLHGLRERWEYVKSEVDTANRHADQEVGGVPGAAQHDRPHPDPTVTPKRPMPRKLGSAADSTTAISRHTRPPAIGGVYR